MPKKVAKSKRANGEGSAYKDGSGWRAAIWYEDAHGKMRCKVKRASDERDARSCPYETRKGVLRLRRHTDQEASKDFGPAPRDSVRVQGELVLLIPAGRKQLEELILTQASAIGGSPSTYWTWIRQGRVEIPLYLVANVTPQDYLDYVEGREDCRRWMGPALD